MLPGRLLIHKSPGARVFDFLNHLFLILFCLTILYPFWSLIILSFSSGKDATALGLHVWISEWSVSSYRFAFSEYGSVGIAYRNSIIKTVVGVFLTIAFTFMGAYPLSKKNLPGRTVLTVYILLTMFFSGGMIPTYFLVKGLGLIDSLWALILPTMVQGYYIIIARNFLMTIDRSYEDAAFMDGCNYLQILLRIIVPLSKPIIATIALWSAVSHWNAWFDALIYINSESKIVLQLLLRRMLKRIVDLLNAIDKFEVLEHTELPSESVKAAVTVITIGPIILIYPFIQKYFIKGIFVGSLKG